MFDATNDVSMQTRGIIYRLLSVCYFEPEAETRDLLVNLRDWIEKAYPQYRERAEGLVSVFGQTDEDILARKVEHTSLFTGPSQQLAPPYGSIYLDAQSRLMGDSTAQVMNQYRQSGLVVDYQEPTDHLAIELEFLHFLAMESQTNSEALETMEVFARNLVLPWVGKFAEKVKQIDKSDFYSDLTELTVDLLRQDFS